MFFKTLYFICRGTTVHGPWLYISLSFRDLCNEIPSLNGQSQAQIETEWL